MIGGISSEVNRNYRRKGEDLDFSYLSLLNPPSHRLRRTVILTHQLSWSNFHTAVSYTHLTLPTIA